MSGPGRSASTATLRHTGAGEDGMADHWPEALDLVAIATARLPHAAT
jgi:hypothetical protein